MTKEDKQILFQDLCARLPYGVKARVYNHWRDEFQEETITIENLHQLIKTFSIGDIKPCLFPLSSMSDEQKKECFKGTPLEIDKYGDVAVKYDFYGNSQYPNLEIYLELIDWLNAHHFDYRGLIDKSLALDATNLGIYE